MTHEEIKKRAAQVADLIDGLGLSDASNIIWEAAQISCGKGNPYHSMINARVVADLVKHLNSRAGVISIEEDGFAELRIQEENTMWNFKIPML